MDTTSGQISRHCGWLARGFYFHVVCGTGTLTSTSGFLFHLAFTCVYVCGWAFTRRIGISCHYHPQSICSIISISESTADWQPQPYWMKSVFIHTLLSEATEMREPDGERARASQMSLPAGERRSERQQDLEWNRKPPDCRGWDGKQIDTPLKGTERHSSLSIQKWQQNFHRLIWAS